MQVGVLDHGSDHLGRPLLVVGGGSPLAVLVSDGIPVRARLDAARVHRLLGPDRVRDRVQVHGYLGPVPRAQHLGAIARLVRQRRLPPGDPLPCGAAVLRLEPARVRVDGADVATERYRAARPDPLLHVEDELLRGLLGRPDDVLALSALLEPAALAVAEEVAPVGLDRHGLTLRVVSSAGFATIRLGSRLPPSTGPPQTRRCGDWSPTRGSTRGPADRPRRRGQFSITGCSRASICRRSPR